MPVGTAFHRLRKQIMFALAQRCELDICFVCDQPITSVTELSVEHREPWENRDTALFWDISNIAFSHRACNRPHINRGGVQPLRPRREGFSWCRHCERELPVADFSMRTANGKRKPRVDCKVCRAERKRMGMTV